MTKSYSKIRHIQEVNQRLEEQYLEEQRLNKLKSKVKGALTGLKTRAQNLKTAVSGNPQPLKNPKVEALLTKIKTRQDYLKKQLEYLSTELSQYTQELQAMTDKGVNDPSIQQMKQLLANYQNAINQTVTQGDSLSKYTTQTTQSTVQNTQNQNTQNQNNQSVVNNNQNTGNEGGEEEEEEDE